MSLRSFSDISQIAIQQLNTFNTKFNSKIKGSFVEKWVKYWKQLAKDYTDVAISVRQESKEKPIKATCYITGLGMLYYCNTHNPNLQSFRAKYLQSANDIVLVSEPLVNSESLKHIRYIDECYNAKLIRYQNLGIASVIWVDNYSNECDLYASQCKHLKIPYSKLFERILDVGFCNIWWITSRKMLDYDVNY